MAIRSSAFDTDLHVSGLAEQLPMLKEDLFRGKREETPDEGVIHAGQWDADAFWTGNSVGALTSTKIVGKTRSSDYGLQTASNTHFDLSNFRGSMEVAQRHWQDGINWFMEDEATPDIKNAGGSKNKDLTGRGFNGEGAGVNNLLYRFGQILHAYQDFYSHTNWVEMGLADGGKWGLRDRLIDETFGLPLVLEPGDFIPGSNNVMIIKKVVDPTRKIENRLTGQDLGAFKSQGEGDFGGANFVIGENKTKVYWAIASDDSGGRQKFEVKTVTDSEVEVGAIVSGALNPLIYKDEDYGAKLRDPSKGGALQKEFFRGVGHGGAAGTGDGQRVSPINKDKPGEKLHSEAMRYAARQTQHEFDRMGYMLFQRYGVDGLKRFADFAVKEEYHQEYVEKYSKAPDPFQWDVTRSTGGSSLAFDGGASPSVEMGAEGEDAEVGGEGFEVRRLNIFNGSDADRDKSRYFLDQARREGGKGWFDLAVLNGAHGEFDFTPAPKSHLDLGFRGYWAERASDDSLTYFVESSNNHVGVVIDQFRVGLDSVVIVDPVTGVVDSLKSIDFANFDQMNSALQLAQNIRVDAIPQARNKVNALSLNETAFLNGEAVVVVDPASLYDDRDDVSSIGKTSGSEYLRFVDYDSTEEWLSLDHESGRLLIDPNHSALPVGGSFDVYVAISDGVSWLDEQRLIFEIGHDAHWSVTTG